MKQCGWFKTGVKRHKMNMESESKRGFAEVSIKKGQKCKKQKKTKIKGFLDAASDGNGKCGDLKKKSWF